MCGAVGVQGILGCWVPVCAVDSSAGVYLIYPIHPFTATDPPLLQIATALSGNTTLKLLDVGGNNVGADGAKALAGATWGWGRG